ncbi:MAG: nucleotidyltransferase family protein [Terriglobia bacterium]
MSTPTAEVVHQLLGLLTHPSAALLSEVRSWDALLALGRYHAILPLLYRKLEPFDLPADVRRSLRQHYTANLARNLHLQAEQEALLGAFETAGVPVIPLKGLRWAEEFYGDLALRLIDDLDLLVRPEDWERADRQLSACGFAPVVVLRERQLRSARTLLYRKETGVPIFIDLHFRLLPYGREDPFAASLWREPLTQETLLLCLCLNFYTHRFARLKFALDLVAFLQRTRATLDWDLVVARAQEFGFTRLCYYSLRLAAALSGQTISALARLAPGGFEQRWTERLLGADPSVIFARAERLAGPYGVLALLVCQAGVGRRAAFARDILFPTRSAIRQDYWQQPERSLVGCYFDRWVRKGSRAVRDSVSIVFSRT